MRHQIMHTGKYKCHRCEAPFTERSKLDKHSRNPESCLKLQKIRSPTIVPSQPEVTLPTDILTPNLQGESSEGADSKILQCPECPKQYLKLDSFREHKIMHTGRFKCQRCGATFSSRSKLNKHSRIPESCIKLQKFRLNSLIKRQSVINRSRFVY